MFIIKKIENQLDRNKKREIHLQLKNFLFIVLAVIFFNSCSKENEAIIERKFDLYDKVLTFDELSLIANEIEQLKTNYSLKSFDFATSEEEIMIDLQPLVLNGKQLHDEIMDFIDSSDDNFGLTPGEISSLQDLHDQQLAELAYDLSIVYSDSNWDTAQVMACIGTALGIDAIHTIITNSTQLATNQGTTQLLKVLAKRYLGWVGLGVAIYSFGVCMNIW